MSSQQLANGVGWFSIGLGLAEIPTPYVAANLIAVTDDSKTRKVLRFYGARGLAAGCGILSQSDPTNYVITHRLALEQAPQGYKVFRDRPDNCEKIVLKPN
jgi:hypothetical protein